VRADRLEAFDAVVEAIPREVGGARLRPEMVRRWPGMNAEVPTSGVLAAASERLGRPIVAAGRGGASDASHFAQVIDVTIDGLGPLGGGAHEPGEYVDAPSLHRRAEVALAVVDALLQTSSG
jgi:glutamate carboxypeptidase